MEEGRKLIFGKKLKKEFYTRDALSVAKNLLGKNLVTKIDGDITVGKIVETEAYKGPEDKAAHSYDNLKTERTKVMYKEEGCAYIYKIYGIYNCFNIVTEKRKKPEAVLIRAVKPVKGLKIMAKRRGLDPQSKFELANGPGKLCESMGIRKKHNGIDLTGNKIFLTSLNKELDKGKIEKTKRINIDYAEEAKNFPWRFILKNSGYLSKAC